MSIDYSLLDRFLEDSFLLITTVARRLATVDSTTTYAHSSELSPRTVGPSSQ